MRYQVCGLGQIEGLDGEYLLVVDTHYGDAEVALIRSDMPDAERLMRSVERFLNAPEPANGRVIDLVEGR